MAELSAVRRVAAHGLLGADDDVIVVPESGWEPFIASCALNGLTGLAVAAFEDGRLDLKDTEAEDLFARHESAMVGVLKLERNLLQICSTLHAANVEHLVLKGSALAHTVYPEASHRRFGDLDIMVRGTHLTRAYAALATLGFARHRPEPRARFTERFGKSATHTRPDGVEVDLHRTLAAGPFGLWLDPDALMDQAVEFSLAGQRLARLSDTGLFLHACLNATLGSKRPVFLPVRDVAQVLQSATLDRDALEDMTRRMHLSVVVTRALSLVNEVLGIDTELESVRFARIPSSSSERRALAAYTTSRRDRSGPAIASVRAIRGLRLKAAYLFALVLPSREFLRTRSSENPSYLRRALKPFSARLRSKHSTTSRSHP